MSERVIYIFGVMSIIFLSITKVEAQENDMYLAISFQTSFNTEDAFVGMDLGIVKKKHFCFFSFGIRPFEKRVLIKDNSGIWFQFSEVRYIVSYGCEVFNMINNSNVGYFIRLSGGYTWADYAGSKRKPDNGFILVPQAGLLFRFPIPAAELNIKLGYEFFNPMHNSISHHRIYVGFTFIANKE